MLIWIKLASVTSDGRSREMRLHHFMMTEHRPKLRRFLAIIIGRGGQTSGQRFSNWRTAIKWLEGEAAASFKGKIERVELYNERKMLIWAKSLA